MKVYALLVLLLVCVGIVVAAPVKITANGEAYGDHGACEGWNGCEDAKTCALRACQANGFNTLVYYGEAKPCTEFNNCNLFDGTSKVDCEWNYPSCEVMAVTDIWCDDGTWSSSCSANLPEQTSIPSKSKRGNSESEGENPEIPEFGVVAAGIALIGALAIFTVRRK